MNLAVSGAAQGFADRRRRHPQKLGNLGEPIAVRFVRDDNQGVSAVGVCLCLVKHLLQ